MFIWTKGRCPNEPWASRPRLSPVLSFFFSCSKETHSSITPLTLERTQRSCRNKRINKQQGESPGLSLEVIPLSVLPLFTLLVNLECKFKNKFVLWFTFEHQKLGWHLIWCLFTSCVTSPWWHVHPWLPVWQDANCALLAAQCSYYFWHWNAQTRFNLYNKHQMQRQVDSFVAQTLLDRYIDVLTEGKEKPQTLPGDISFHRL